MAAVKAIIFDLDDTLYPEWAYAFSGFDAVAAAFRDLLGDPATAAGEMRRLFDTEHRPRVFNAILRERGLRDAGGEQSTSVKELVERMIATYRKHAPTISLHADADEVLTRLGARYKLGLITDGPAVSQWAKIDALGLRGRLDEIIITAELGSQHAKPHPRAFELMAERLGVTPTACVYVADNPAKDFVAPNALGWTTVRIVRPDGIYRDEPPAEKGEPDHTITTLIGLPANLLGRLGLSLEGNEANLDPLVESGGDSS